MSKQVFRSLLRWLIGLRLWHSRLAVAGLVISTWIIILAIFAPFIATHSPSGLTLEMLNPPSAEHYFGTDSYGRDVFSRIVMGSRESLGIAIAALGIGFIGGSILGLLAAYFRGMIDNLCSRFVDIMMSFPSIMIALFVLAIFTTAGKTPLTIAIGLTLIPRFARVIRGSTLPICEEDYVLAAKAAGARNLRIIVRHIIPNLVGPIMVLCSIYLPYVILLESSLSFLGLGPPPEVPTWGRIIADGRPYLRTAPWVAVFPGIAIMITVIGFNLIGDGLRDLLDPKTAGRLTQQ